MKKIISLIAAASLISGTFISAYAAEKNDKPILDSLSEWAKSDIADAENLGILDDVSLEWTGNITRENFCSLVYNMLDKAMNINWKKADKSVFDDAAADSRITALNLEGIINGKGERIFDPDGSLTREEAAAILCRTAEYADVEGLNDEKTNTYPDDSEISEWAKDSVYRLSNLKIMNGTDNGFEPKGGYTAEQSAASVLRLYNIINNKDIDLSFADKLNERIDKSKNYMFSPLSIKTVLAMAANGADGDTKKEILDAAGIDDLEKYNDESKKMIEKYSQSDILRLNSANSIWINRDKTSQTFSDEFTKTISDAFGADSAVVTNDTMVKKINAWVSDKTNEKITSIIGEDNDDFWAVLINAVYFKARWQNEFYPGATSKDIFTDRNGAEKSIDFMNETAWLRYGDNNGVKIIEMPYCVWEDIKNGEYIEKRKLDDMDVSMFLMMSDKPFNPVSELDKAELSSQYIDLSVPKFKIEYSSDLKTILEDMGIKKVFTEQAETEKMFSEKNMWITNMLHKTYINVDEEGTEAAAVTAGGGSGSALPPEPIEVKYNKPFAFVIRDNINGEILFMGEYAFAD